MKNRKTQIVSLFILAASLLLLSCKKDRTCTCTTTNTSAYEGGGTSTQTVVSVKDLKKQSKQSANQVCASYTQTSSIAANGVLVMNVYTMTVVSDCVLK